MNILLGGISIIGSIFLLNLGIKSLLAANSEFLDYTPRPLLLKEIMIANLTNPNPYLFWFTVGAPIMVRSFQHNLSKGLSFLVSFYLGLVGIKLILAIAAGKSRDFLQGFLYRITMLLLSIMLICFAIYLMLDGFVYLRLLQNWLFFYQSNLCPLGIRYKQSTILSKRFFWIDYFLDLVFLIHNFSCIEILTRFSSLKSKSNIE